MIDLASLANELLLGWLVQKMSTLAASVRIPPRLVSRGGSSKKNPLGGEARVWGFSKPGVDFLLLMKTVGTILSPPT
jgi:hypothetical protein